MSKLPHIWQSPAKINLFLHITSKRADGYHNLQSIFQLLDFYDEIQINVRDDGLICRTSGNEDIDPEHDLLIKSAKALQQFSGCTLGADIAIDKRIPAGAGLGGGSSNAATVLIALNQLWNIGLSQQQLMEIGVNLGADVPFFIFARSAWVEGIGEQLSPIDPPQSPILLIYVNQHSSTQEIFSHKALTMSPMIGKISDFSELSATRNDTQQAAIDKISEISDALNFLNTCSHRTDQARMSGTGSCVFAPFESEKDALAALDKMPSNWLGIQTSTMNTSPMHNWAVAKR